MIITTCCNCDRTADERQRCAECQGAVCIRCAQYDDNGDLWCPACLEDATGSEVDMDMRGMW